MAPKILPFLYDRPLTMHRFPDGVGGEEFYEKDAPGDSGLCRKIYDILGDCRPGGAFCPLQ